MALFRRTACLGESLSGKGTTHKGIIMVLNQNHETTVHIQGCFGVADGLNLPMQEPTDTDLQNAMYNGIKNS